MELTPEMQAQIREVVNQFTWAPFTSAKVSTQAEIILNQAINREVTMRSTQDFIVMEFNANASVNPQIQSEANSQSKTFKGEFFFGFNIERIRSIYPKICTQVLPLLSEADRAGVQTVCSNLISH
jgi:hypothetical protein